MKELNTVNLTTNQKRVIAKIVASPTPKIAGEEISGDQNLIGARNELARLGAIQYAGGEAMLTDIGQRLAQEDNLVDASGQLTPDGQSLAYSNPKGEQDKDVTQQPALTPPPGMPEGPGSQELNMSHTLKYEPLELLCELLEHAVVVEPSGEMKIFKRTPHKQLQDLVKALKVQGHTREKIIHHIRKHKEFSYTEDEEKSSVKKPRPRKPSTPEQRQKARARHWRKTGVSDRTLQWMKDNGML